MGKRRCSPRFYTEMKSPSCQGRLCPSLHRILQSPRPGGHAAHCSLRPSPWLSLGTVLRTQLPHPEPGAILLARVPVPGNDSGNSQAIGVLLLARDEWAGWSPGHGLGAPPEQEHCRCPVSCDSSLDTARQGWVLPWKGHTSSMLSPLGRAGQHQPAPPAPKPLPQQLCQPSTRAGAHAGSAGVAHRARLRPPERDPLHSSVPENTSTPLQLISPLLGPGPTAAPRRGCPSFENR